MENPLEEQKRIYGHNDAPPMIFLSHTKSALDLENSARSSEPETSILQFKSKSGKAGDSVRGNTDNGVRNKDAKNEEKEAGVISPCDLPGDFPPEFTFRALAAYSLLRTLSIELRLSPFTPNVFLRALYLPVPNPIIGQVHVALLRILLVKKLSKGMGYSYKPNGGGMGVHKRRQLDNIRWPLLAGDNLTHLDTLSWPLFYDDYCHLTADRLWANYHGRVNGLDDLDEMRHFVDTRNIGSLIPASSQSWSTDKKWQQKSFDKRLNSTFDGNHGQLPVEYTSTTGHGEKVERFEENCDNSDTEDEYKNDNDASDDEWETPRPKKKPRRSNQNQNNNNNNNSKAAGSRNSGPLNQVEHSLSSIRKSATFIPNACQRQSVTQFPQSQQQFQVQPQLHVPDYRGTYGCYAMQAAQNNVGNSMSAPINNNSGYYNTVAQLPLNNIASRIPYQNIHRNNGTNFNHANYSSLLPIPISTYASNSNMDSGRERNGSASLPSVENNHVLRAVQYEEEKGVITGLTDPFSQQERITEFDGTNHTNDDANIINGDDPLRIRGGGKVDGHDITRNTSFFTPLGSDNTRPNSNSSLGSRRGLPIQNKSGPPRRSLPLHKNPTVTSKNQQQRIQQYPQHQYNQQQSYNQHDHQKQQRDFQHQRMYDTNHLQKQSSFSAMQASIKTNPAIYANSKGNSKYISFSCPDPNPNQTTSTQKTEQVVNKNNPLEVPSGIAAMINDFVSGVGVGVKQKVGEIEPIDNDNLKRSNGDTIEKGCDDESEWWLHFKPLKSMRSGVPYHRIPIDQKMNVLEFLIDELLTVDAISLELTRRHYKTDFRNSSYGSLPKKEEYESLENNDECAVCGLEGDLLCCDGCVSSYHSQCLNIKAGQRLAEGNWLCPECKLVDPCNFGPLNGGRKSSLDWFSFNDISAEVSGTIHFTPPPSLDKDQSKSRESSNDDSKSLLQNPIAKEVERDGSNQSCMKLSDNYTIKPCDFLEKEENKMKWKDMKYIIVHGYVFYRKRSVNQAPKAPKPYLSMTKSELYSYLSQLDTRLLKCWPLAQIPNTDQFDKFPSVKAYFASCESVDPFKYDNKYRNASVCCLMKAGIAHQILKLMQMDFQSECYQPNTSLISKFMIEDTSHDTKLSRSLRARTDLFNPFLLMKGYMVRLEQTLRKSCLMDEFWIAGKLKSNSELWTARVRGAGSIKGLSQLLLMLVNNIHRKAFSPVWFHSHVAKSSESHDLTTERNYKYLPDDWNKEKERLKRSWQTTPSHLILSLCSSIDNDLMAFASEIRSDIFIAKSMNVIKSKRKLKKVSQMNKATNFGAGDTNIFHHAGGETRTQLRGTESKKSGIDMYTDTIQHEEGKSDANTPITNPSVDPCSKNESQFKMHKEPKQNHSNITSANSFACHKNAKGFHADSSSFPFVAIKDTSHQMSQKSNQNHAKDGLLGNPSHLGRKLVENINNQLPKITEIGTGNIVSAVKDTDQSVSSQVPKSDVDHSRKKTHAAKTKKKMGKQTRKTVRCRTRHSGRLSSENHLVEKVNDQYVTDRKEFLQQELLQGMALQIENAKKQKIPGLEKLAKGLYTEQGIWPIAGGKIFPTVGKISPTEIKKIARNAGKVLATNLNYNTSHEVAQVCYGHIWRKRVNECYRFEELLLLMRILESSLDRETIQFCENLVRRGKSAIQKVVRCSITNRSNGSLEHFVVNKKSMKGCWVPDEHLDLSCLILGLTLRRQTQMKKRQEFLRAKEAAERAILGEERVKQTIEATKEVEEEKKKRTIAFDAKKAAKAKKQEEKAKKKLKREAKKQEEVTKKNLEREAKKAAKLLTMAEKKKSRELAAKKSQPLFALNQEIVKWEKERNMAFTHHEMQIKYTLQAWKTLNKIGVPEADIILVRKQTLERLRVANERLRRCNVPIMNVQAMMKVIFELEKKAASDLSSDEITKTVFSNGPQQSHPNYSHVNHLNVGMLSAQPNMTQMLLSGSNLNNSINPRTGVSSYNRESTNDHQLNTSFDLHKRVDIPNDIFSSRSSSNVLQRNVELYKNNHTRYQQDTIQEQCPKYVQTNNTELFHLNGPAGNFTSGSPFHTLQSERMHHEYLPCNVAYKESHSNHDTNKIQYSKHHLSGDNNRSNQTTISTQLDQGPRPLGINFSESQQKNNLTNSHETGNRQCNELLGERNYQQSNMSSFSTSFEKQQYQPIRDQQNVQQTIQYQHQKSNQQEQNHQDRQSNNDQVINSLEQQLYSQQQLLQQLQQQKQHFAHGQFNQGFNNNYST